MRSWRTVGWLSVLTLGLACASSTEAPIPATKGTGGSGAGSSGGSGGTGGGFDPTGGGGTGGCGTGAQTVSRACA